MFYFVLFPFFVLFLCFVLSRLFVFFLIVFLFNSFLFPSYSFVCIHLKLGNHQVIGPKFIFIQYKLVLSSDEIKYIGPLPISKINWVILKTKLLCNTTRRRSIKILIRNLSPFFIFIEVEDIRNNLNLIATSLPTQSRHWQVLHGRTFFTDNFELSFLYHLRHGNKKQSAFSQQPLIASKIS